MSSYAKSLLALGITALAVVITAFWLKNRIAAFDDLAKERDDMRRQITASQSDRSLIAAFEQRLDALKDGIKQITDKFVGKDRETPQLVKAVVGSAALSGMEMVNAYKLESSSDALSAPIGPGQGRTVAVLSHEIILKGTYPGFVRFLQSMAAWDMGARIEALLMAPGAEGASSDEINVTLRLSVFSLAQ